MGDAAPPDAAQAALQLLQALAAQPQMGGQGIDVGAAGALLQALAGSAGHQARRRPPAAGRPPCAAGGCAAADAWRARAPRRGCPASAAAALGARRKGWRRRARRRLRLAIAPRRPPRATARCASSAWPSTRWRARR
jgi:hypothetical protein